MRMARTGGVVPRVHLLMAMVLVVTTTHGNDASAAFQQSPRVGPSLRRRRRRRWQRPHTAAGPAPSFLVVVGGNDDNDHDGAAAAAESTVVVAPPAERAPGGTITHVKTRTKELHVDDFKKTATATAAASATARLALMLLLSSLLPPFVMPSAASTTTSDVTRGAQLFSAECADCHVHGGNTMDSRKTLKKDALLKYQGTVSDTNQLVNYVSNQRPHIAFDFPTIRSTSDYSDVIEYVLDQAMNDKWK